MKWKNKIIKALEEPKSAQIKYTLNKQKNKRIIIKKKDDSKPSKFKWKLKLEDSASLDDEINNNLIKKPKKICLVTIPRTSSVVKEKKVDYLREIIAEKEKKRVKSSEKDNEDNIKINFRFFNW